MSNNNKDKVLWVECDDCDGTGHDILMECDGITCQKCNGTGEEE